MRPRVVPIGTAVRMAAPAVAGSPDVRGGPLRRSTVGQSNVRCGVRAPRSLLPTQAPGGVNQGPGTKPGAMRRHSFRLRGAAHRPSAENR
jgi:hypothetical protein